MLPFDWSMKSQVIVYSIYMVVVMPSTPKERQLAELAKSQFGDTEYRNYMQG